MWCGEWSRTYSSKQTQRSFFIFLSVCGVIFPDLQIGLRYYSWNLENRSEILQLFLEDRDLLKAFSILDISLSNLIKSAKILKSVGLWISTNSFMYCCKPSRYCLSDEISRKVLQNELYLI